LRGKLNNVEINCSNGITHRENRFEVVISARCAAPFAFHAGLLYSASFRVIIQQNEHTQTVIIDRRKKCTCSSYSFVILHGGVRLLCLSTTREMRFLCLAQRNQGSYRLISRSCITLSWLNVNFFSKIIIRNDYLCRAHYGVTRYQINRKWNIRDLD